jgi:hypothetical protein
MKMFARITAFALALIFIAATSAEAQRGPGRGHGGGFGHGPGRGGIGRGGGFGHGPGHGGGFGRGHGHSFPRRGGVYYPTPYPYPSGYGCGFYGCSDVVYAGSVDCAPEVVEGNVKATDRTLKTLASSSAFADAKTFKKEVARISSMKNNSDKTNNYLALIGIHPEDSAAIVEFIGARDIKGAWLVDLQRNSGLSADQAEQAAKAVQSALRGGLR